MNNGPAPTPKEKHVQDAVADCCPVYRLPDKPCPDWDRTFEELGVTQSQLNCICEKLKPYGIEGEHNFSSTTPQDLVDEQD